MDIATVEKQLQEERNELIKRVESIGQDYRQGRSADSQERAVETENDDVLAELRREANEEIQQIEVALQRLKNGTYGTCAVCGEAIAIERLNALPFANKCIDCS
ncbi:MAG: TraR/DksA family transcriptional regulator [Gammaproteobacteria bacterium]